MPSAVGQTTKTLAPYTPAVKSHGLIYVSGQLGMKDGKLLDGVEAQTRGALENLKALLESAGSSLAKTVKCTVYIKNMDDFDAINKVYASFFQDWKPARVCVEVARLPVDALIEIDAIAEE